MKSILRLLAIAAICAALPSCESTNPDTSPEIQQATYNLFAPTNDTPNMFAR